VSNFGKIKITKTQVSILTII